MVRTRQVGKSDKPLNLLSGRIGALAPGSTVMGRVAPGAMATTSDVSVRFDNGNLLRVHRCRLRAVGKGDVDVRNLAVSRSSR